MPLRPNAINSMLRSASLFSDCTATEIRERAGIAEVTQVPEGATVIREGAPPGDLFIVVEGAAEARRNGRKLRSLFIGDCFGELALLTGSTRTATVKSVTPLELLQVRRDDFGRLLEVSPTIGVKLARSLAARVEADSPTPPI